MRPIIRTTICALVAAALAAPAVAASNYYLKLDNPKGESGAKSAPEKQIEIHSFSWGTTQTGAGFGYGGGGGTGKIAVQNFPPPRAAPGTAGKGMVMKGSTIGENAPATSGGPRVAGGDVDGDGRADVGASKTVTVGGSRSAGQATGKRQHKPLHYRAYTDTSASAGVGDFTRDGKASGMTPYFNPKELGVDKPIPWKSHTQKQPLQSGSLIVRGKFPGCAVGTRYPTLTLVGKDQRYVLHDAVVTSCAAAGDSLPMEEVSFNYASYRGSPVRQSPK